MKDLQDTLAFIWPLLHHWWIILLFAGVALFIGVGGAINKKQAYQANIAIKLKLSESKSNSSGDEIGIYVTAENLASEAVWIKSDFLIERAIRELPFEVSYYEIVKTKEVEIYKRSPFQLTYWKVRDSSLIDKKIHFTFLDDQQYQLALGSSEDDIQFKGTLGDTLLNAKFDMVIDPILEFWTASILDKEKPRKFAFKICSLHNLVEEFGGKELFVRPMEQDIPVIQLYLSHESPEKAQDFLNRLAKVYVDEVVLNRKNAISKGLNFISKQLDSISADLIQIESKIVQFKQANKLISYRTETDNTLKQLLEVKNQLIQLELEGRELSLLLTYLQQDSLAMPSLPDLESIQDMSYAQRLNTLNALISQKLDLEVQYRKDHPKIIRLNEQINSDKESILQAVENALNTNQIKAEQLGGYLQEHKKRLSELPEINWNLSKLQREFNAKEIAYNLLIKKQIESQIQKASTISLHKILHSTTKRESSLKGQRIIFIVVSLFIGVSLAIILIFLKQYLLRQVYNTHRIEESLDFPIWGQIRWRAKLNENVLPSYRFMASRMVLEQYPAVIAITSYERFTGKSTFAFFLVQALLRLDQSVLLVESFKPRFKEPVKILSNEHNKDITVISLYGMQKADDPLNVYTNLAYKLPEYRKNYDFIIIDGPAMGQVLDFIPVLKSVDKSMILVREAYSQLNRLLRLEENLKLLQVENCSYVFHTSPWQGVSKSTFYRKNLRLLWKMIRRR